LLQWHTPEYPSTTRAWSATAHHNSHADGGHDSRVHLALLALHLPCIPGNCVSSHQAQCQDALSVMCTSKEVKSQATHAGKCACTIQVKMRSCNQQPSSQHTHQHVRQRKKPGVKRRQNWAENTPLLLTCREGRSHSTVAFPAACAQAHLRVGAREGTATCSRAGGMSPYK